MRGASPTPGREDVERMVASAGRITAGRGYDYLTRDVATSKHDSYTGRGEAPGVWSSRGASLIGLAGAVAVATHVAFDQPSDASRQHPPWLSVLRQFRLPKAAGADTAIGDDVLLSSRSASTNRWTTRHAMGSVAWHRSELAGC
jgi:hypothetical protein